jgi:hypothetical protein
MRGDRGDRGDRGRPKKKFQNTNWTTRKGNTHHRSTYWESRLGERRNPWEATIASRSFLAGQQATPRGATESESLAGASSRRWWGRWWPSLATAMMAIANSAANSSSRVYCYFDSSSPGASCAQGFLLFSFLSFLWSIAASSDLPIDVQSMRFVIARETVDNRCNEALLLVVASED